MKKTIAALAALLVAASLLSGCTQARSVSNSADGANSVPKESQYAAWLKADAAEGLKGAIDRDYRRLTIISGSLNKMHSAEHPELVLGTALGALEADIFTEESEYRRMDNNINISPETKRELVQAGLLNVLTKNREVLNHIYQDILKPYSEKQATAQQLTVEQERAIDKTTELLAEITQVYGRLSTGRSSMNVAETEGVINQLDKLQSQASSLFFPIK